MHLTLAHSSTLAAAERPLRIAHFVGRCDKTTSNGVERAAYELSVAQAQLGHVVKRFVLDDRPLPSSATAAAATFTRFVAAAGGLALGRGIPASLYRALHVWRPDIVHLHSLHVPENILLAHKLRSEGVPYCVSAHGAVTPVTMRRGRLRKTIFRLVCEDRYLRSAAFVHALTAVERDALRRYGVRRPIPVVPNGVALDTAADPTAREALDRRFPAARGRRVFLFVGRLDPVHKGLDLLLRAFAAAALPDAVLVLIGPDWRGGLGMLRALRSELGLSQSTIFAGEIFGDEKRQLLHGADVFVHASRWEGVSLAVLEAAAAGKPVLLTPAADPGGALGGGGAALIAQPIVTDLTRTLRLFARMERRTLAEMGMQGQRVVEAQFSWPVAAGSLVDAYRTVTRP